MRGAAAHNTFASRLGVSPESHRAAQGALSRLLDRLERDGYAGWDPFDALSSPVLRGACRTALLRRAAIQALKLAPVNPRPALGIRRRSHTKALALLASAYARLVAADPRYAAAARELAQQLVDRAVACGDGVGWAYDFDVQTRWGFYRAGEPNAIATAFAAHGLLDVAAVCDAPELESFAARSLDFAGSTLARPGGFFAYTPHSTVAIHNANVLVSGVGARVAQPGSEMWRACRDALDYSLARQRPDGSWPYGEDDSLAWVDGFHTGYVLQGCARWHSTGENGPLAAALARGAALYTERLIDPDGAARASLASRYPLETHAAATAVSTLVTLARSDPAHLPTVERVLAWSLPRLQRPDGSFVFRVHRHWTNRMPYVRWSDAHMALALADVVGARP